MKPERIPIPEKGKTAWPLSTWWSTQVASTVNALQGLEIKRGSGDSVHWSDGNLVITLKGKDEFGGTDGTLNIADESATVSVSNVDTIIVPDGSLTDDGSGQVTLAFTVTVEEEDGTPTGTPDTIKFPNGSVTNNGDGSFSIATGASVYQAEVQSWSTDYCVVRKATYNESTNVWDDDGVDINAALPHGQRNAEQPSSAHPDATAILWPSYTAGDIVLICQPIGGTGVEVSAVDLEWMILPNYRKWCFEMRVCTASTTYYMIMPAYTCSASSNASFNTVD